MRLVMLDHAPAGVTLARDVRSGVPGEIPLLRAGARLEEAYRRGLAERGVRAVWIEDAASVGVDPLPPLDLETRAEAERRVTSVMGEAAAAMRAGRAPGGDVVDALARVAGDIAVRVAGLPEAAYALDDLATADAYTHRHSVQVTVLGLLLADRHWRRHGWVDWRGRPRFDGREARLSSLGLGLLLHDLGKLAIAPEILGKAGPLAPEEWAIMRRHPDTGVEMLSPAASPMVLEVVRAHHERLDGSGYPRGLAGPEVHEFARIAAIADTYDAITSDRPYQPGRPPHVALNALGTAAPAAYDAALVETFRRVAVPFPEGTEVPLPDGGSALVVDAAVADPWLPVVRRADGTEGVADLRHLDDARAAVAPDAIP